MANTLPASVASLPNLGPGSTGNDVLALQKALVAAGYLSQADFNTGPGTYGPKTTAAVSAWQSAMGINTQGNPGYFGPLSKNYITAHPTNTSTQSQPAANTSTRPSSTSTTQSSVVSQPVSSAPSSTKQYGQLPANLLSQITTSLGPNMNSDPAQVLALQKALVAAGYMTSAQLSTGPGIYGPATTAAVALWQASNNINTQGNSGYFGPISKAYIQSQATQQQLNQGSNLPVISSTQSASDYSGASNTQNSGLVQSDIENTIAANLPDSAYKTIVPQLDFSTPEGKAAMEKIETSYYDIMQQQLTAQTEQEKAMADYNYKQLTDYLQNNLGVTLSNDATQAWDQIESLKNSYGAQGIEGSGMQAEAMDDYLRKVRSNDATARTNEQTQETDAQKTYFMTYATPEQIKELAATNPELAQSWGLTPSDEVKQAMSFSTLKSKYPTLTDDQINKYISSMFDENGNYRSTLYQKYMTGGNANIDPGSTSYQYDQYGNIKSATVLPASNSGILDIQKASEQYQQENAQAQAIQADLKAHQEVTPSNADTQFIRPVTTTSTSSQPAATAPAATTTNPIPTATKTAASTPTTSTTKTSSGGIDLDAISKAIAQIQQKTSAIAAQVPTATKTSTSTTTPSANTTAQQWYYYTDKTGTQQKYFGTKTNADTWARGQGYI